MRIGVMTGGGDCPGLNAVIRAIVRRTGGMYGGEVVGFRFGWAGLVERNIVPLGIDQVSGILPRGGTILGTSRTNPYKIEGGVKKIHECFKEERLDGLIAAQRAVLPPSRPPGRPEAPAGNGPLASPAAGAR